MSKLKNTYPNNEVFLKESRFNEYEQLKKSYMLGVKASYDVPTFGHSSSTNLMNIKSIKTIN